MKKSIALNVSCWAVTATLFSFSSLSNAQNKPSESQPQLFSTGVSQLLPGQSSLAVALNELLPYNMRKSTAGIEVTEAFLPDSNNSQQGTLVTCKTTVKFIQGRGRGADVRTISFNGCELLKTTQDQLIADTPLLSLDALFAKALQQSGTPQK